MEQMKKRTWAEVDLSALEHNYRALRGMLPRGCRFLGVVKANAYGHGAVPVAKKLEALGAEYLAVACLDEAIELRQAGISTPILILGPTFSEFAGELQRYDLTQAVQDGETARALSAAATDKPIKVHIKVDTGMSRLGFLCDEEHQNAAVEEIAEVWALPGLCGHGVGLEFHEDPEVEHFGRKGTGMLLVPGMVFTIEPMINMGTYEVFVDEEDGWTVVTEDELPSAQWEHTFLMTDEGLEILTY